MQAKLRQVGNSMGVTIPAGELRALSANIGDILELNITKVIRRPRAGWENAANWRGAEQESVHLESIVDNDFDRTEWQW